METTPWIAEPQPDLMTVSRLQKDAGLSYMVAWLLAQRGVVTADLAREFLHPAPEQMHDPYRMRDMDKAAERLHRAVMQHEKVLVYGDYDVDGTTSVALVAGFLKGIGLKEEVLTYVPHRYSEGYGVSSEGIAYAGAKGCTLMITLDCGTKDFDPLDLARKMLIDVIVCDHHLPEAKLPNAYAILNPKRSDCLYPFKELSGCGVAFKLLQALAGKMEFPPDQIFHELDLVAVSIGADLVELMGENRVMAHLGMQRLRDLNRPGIRAMLFAADIQEPPSTIRDISFTLGPRINAAGRMGHAQVAVDLLLEECEQDAHECAKTLEELNRARRTVDESTTRKAIDSLELGDPDAYCNLVWGKEWHRGVVGIVASRLVEHRYRPSIVLSEEEGMLIGSARSVDGVDIHQALGECADLLTQFGGHPMAAGLQLRKQDLPAFRARIESAVRTQLAGCMPQPQIRYHLEVLLEDLTTENFFALQQLEPFGPGNPPPVFVARGVQTARAARTVGADGKHLKLLLQAPAQPGGTLEAVGFNLGHLKPQLARWGTLDIAFQWVRNTWQELRSTPDAVKLNLHLLAVKPSAKRAEETE